MSLDAANLIPGLVEAGVTAFKIEGRQRSRAYTQAVVRTFRRAVDDRMAGRPIAAGLVAARRGQDHHDRCLQEDLAVRSDR